MNRHHVTYLDRALARLLEERARLTRGADAQLAAPALDDLLRRSDGEVRPDALRAVFDAVHAACVVGATDPVADPVAGPMRAEASP